MSSHDDLLFCAHGEFCGGCAWIEQKRASQIQAKSDLLLKNLELLKQKNFAFEFVDLGPDGLRDRADLIYQEGHYGFFNKDKTEVFDLKNCAQMSADLQAFYLQIQNIKWPIKKGSLRLRVGPNHARGLWLDFANWDIKELLAEQSSLRQLMALGISIEIGQKRKNLISVGPALKLGDPEFRIWSQTYWNGQAVPLFSLIGGFTQTGPIAIRRFADIIQTWVRQSDAFKISEFGAGIGTLTFPASGKNSYVTVYEKDPSSVSSLQKTLTALPEWQPFINIKTGDYQKKERASFQETELILVNPPRSGFGDFLQPLFAMEIKDRPREFIYMSCYLESFIHDAAAMIQLGYGLRKITLVDQFPQTPHFEILSLWDLI